MPAFYTASSVASESSPAPVPEFEQIRSSEESPFPEFVSRTVRSKAGLQSLPSGRILLHYPNIGKGELRSGYFRLSSDGGSTYSPEEAIEPHRGPAGTYLSPSPVLLERGVATLSFRDSNIYVRYRADRDRNWAVTAQVNDELSSVVGSVSLKQGPGGEIYCTWIDDRKGFPLVFFSSSVDGGKSWAPNKPVEFDFREGDQGNPHLAIGAGGRVLVFWEDWRDRKTLLDIRYAYSDDRGMHWIPGGKVNDDGLHVWQIDLNVASAGENIYVAFSDFRDPGEEGDNDWNIYFASSDDNGKTFGANRRLNDVTEGIDKHPRLAVTFSGKLFCAWRTGRNTLFGEPAVAYSYDNGQSWSPSKVLVSRDSAEVVGINIVQHSDRELWVTWREDGFGTRESAGRSVSLAAQAEGAPLIKKAGERPAPLELRTGDVLFSDDFESGKTGWREASGLWLNVRGSYMGTAPGKDPYFVSYAPFQEPESYVLEGRFLLDPVAHYISSIYLRTGDSGKRHFVISSQFRAGSWISIKDDDRETGLHRIGGRLLDEERFPFGRNKWYRFRVVVTPEQIDYYVEGRRILGVLTGGALAPGSVGLGGYTSSPTYFDDIRVYSIKP